MAGGTFKLSQSKTRPGVYVNVRNGKPPKVVSSYRGVAAIPLIGYDWGPREEWIKLSSDSPDKEKAKLGRSIYDDNNAMRMLRLMFSGATTVYVYIADGGKKAEKKVTAGEGQMTVSAKYKGTLGNSIKIVSVENPLGGFDVSLFVNGVEAEVFEGVKKVEDIIGKSEYVDFTGTGEMQAFASASLEGGTNDSEGNASVSKFLDMSEKIRMNTLCFPVDDEALKKSAVSKIRYIRESIGWKCQAVIPNCDADYEGIINLTNAFDMEGKDLTIPEACAWLAGMTAGADYNSSLTYCVVEGATKVVGEKSNEESIEAIKKGETFFSVDEAGAVILEYDINSKVSMTNEDPVDIMKNRPLRVYDSFANELLITYRPGKYDGESDGHTLMAGVGRALLQKYQEAHAIKNVNLEEDFIIDEEMSEGDSVYVRVGLQPVDSADKYYFDVVSK